MNIVNNCPLCQTPGSELLWRNDHLRVIAVDDAMYPGFTRVIWHQHVTEMTQLPTGARHELMDVVWKVEHAQRQVLQPFKINMAQFGNITPHLHWHIIPRWSDDSHFPETIWAPAPHRSAAQELAWVEKKADILRQLPQYHAELQKALDS